jgi:hypothetical protein
VVARQADPIKGIGVKASKGVSAPRQIVALRRDAVPGNLRDDRRARNWLIATWSSADVGHRRNTPKGYWLKGWFPMLAALRTG